MTASIDGTYYIKTDENNFILQEIKFKGKDSENEGDNYFVNVGYYGTLKQCVRGYFKYATRNATYGGREITELSELLVKIDAIENKIDNYFNRSSDENKNMQ